MVFWGRIFLIFFALSVFGSEPQIIFLLGKPGVGKGTHAVRLREEFHLPYISTGELLKENIRQGTPLGKIVKSHVEDGTLPPDQLVVDVFFQHYQTHNYPNGCIVDGFPRTLNQARLLDEKLGAVAKFLVIYLNASDEVVTERILGRLMCGNCFVSYNIFSAPPKKTGICDLCQSELYHRKDDNINVIKTRLSAFHEKTAPIFDYYQKQEKLHEIDSEQSIEVVYDSILKVIKENK